MTKQKATLLKQSGKTPSAIQLNDFFRVHAMYLIVLYVDFVTFERVSFNYKSPNCDNMTSFSIPERRSAVF